VLAAVYDGMAGFYNYAYAEFTKPYRTYAYLAFDQFVVIELIHVIVKVFKGLTISPFVVLTGSFVEYEMLYLIKIYEV
jgi:hypothetical protein